MAPDSTTPREPTRRTFLGWGALWAGLAACGAMGMAVVGKFLLPTAGERRVRRMYVGLAKDLAAGESRPFLAPDGARYLLTNDAGTIAAFNATCPHLGCKVHWEAENTRFFCPCHGGAFDTTGAPIAGPPLDEDTPLRELPLEVTDGVIYALVPLV
ncbi:MAG: QcrA and Rieske domain-containing protein [Planctomycetota bacterium]|jgi:Rieske Fe-S protein